MIIYTFYLDVGISTRTSWVICWLRNEVKRIISLNQRLQIEMVLYPMKGMFFIGNEERREFRLASYIR